MSTYRGLYFEKFSIGQKFVTASQTMTDADIQTFARLSGDTNPLHLDDAFARQTPYQQRIAHGLLGVAISSGLAAQTNIFEGTTAALVSQSMNYKKPVFISDTIQLTLTVTKKRDLGEKGVGWVTFETRLTNQRGEIVTTGEWVLLMKKRPSSPVFA